MVSLSPGTLRKLLQNVGDKEFRVAGEHRSALLQASFQETSKKKKISFFWLYYLVLMEKIRTIISSSDEIIL